MTQLEPHFFCIYTATNTALNMVQMLPQNDLVSEIYDLLCVELDIIMHLIEHKHYGSKNIECYLNHLKDLNDQVARLEDND